MPRTNERVAMERACSLQLTSSFANERTCRERTCILQLTKRTCRDVSRWSTLLCLPQRKTQRTTLRQQRLPNHSQKRRQRVRRSGHNVPKAHVAMELLAGYPAAPFTVPSAGAVIPLGMVQCKEELPVVHPAAHYTGHEAELAMLLTQVPPLSTACQLIERTCRDGAAGRVPCCATRGA